jgi:NADH dehydrogenase
MKANTVAVFGGSGFLGRYVIRKLIAEGKTVKVVCRHPSRLEHIKLLGKIGQIVPVYGDITDEGSIKPILQDVSYVVNLIGILFETDKQSFADVHAKGAEKLARLVKKAGIKHFVHLSTIGVDQPNRSKYIRTKLIGESAVLSAFPEVTILRPSMIFGKGDNLFNCFARLIKTLPFAPVFGEGDIMFQPVFVDDVAAAIVKCLNGNKYHGKIFELGGADIITFRELIEKTSQYIGSKKQIISISFIFANMLVRALEVFPNRIISSNQLELLRFDNIANEDMGSLASLGIEPTKIEAVVPFYLKK